MGIDKELRGIFAEESAQETETSPVITAVSRRVLRRRTGAGAALSVLAVGVLGAGLLAAGGIRTTDPATSIPSPTPSSESGRPVTLDVQGVFDHFATFEQPACDEPPNLEPNSVNGITAELSIRGEFAPGTYAFSVRYENTGDSEATFLAAAGGVILVKDGVVVTRLGEPIGSIQSFDAEPGGWTAFSENQNFGYTSTCAFIEELDALRFESFGDGTEEFDPTDEQLAHFDARLLEIMERSLEPGTYEIYAWTPVVFGEQAGAARVFREEGVWDLGTLMHVGMGSEQLDLDPELATFCTTTFIDGSGNATVVDGYLPSENEQTNGHPDFGQVDSVQCDVVDKDLFESRLTRFVPEDYIVAVADGVLVSEPITIVIE